MRSHWAVVVLFLATLAANSQTPTHVGPDRLYPNPALTPGKADTVSVPI